MSVCPLRIYIVPVFDENSLEVLGILNTMFPEKPCVSSRNINESSFQRFPSLSLSWDQIQEILIHLASMRAPNNRTRANLFQA